jgi:hypothetical protein
MPTRIDLKVKGPWVQQMLDRVSECPSPTAVALVVDDSTVPLTPFDIPESALAERESV